MITGDFSTIDNTITGKELCILEDRFIEGDNKETNSTSHSQKTNEIEQSFPINNQGIIKDILSQYYEEDQIFIKNFYEGENKTITFEIVYPRCTLTKGRLDHVSGVQMTRARQQILYIIKALYHPNKRFDISNGSYKITHSKICQINQKE